MGLTKQTATARLARDIQQSEASIAIALRDTIGLLHTAATAGADINDVDPALGHKPMVRMHSAVGQLIELRGSILRVHGDLAKVGQEVGTMDEPTCPEYRALGTVEESTEAA